MEMLFFFFFFRPRNEDMFNRKFCSLFVCIFDPKTLQLLGFGQLVPESLNIPLTVSTEINSAHLQNALAAIQTQK